MMVILEKRHKISPKQKVEQTVAALNTLLSSFSYRENDKPLLQMTQKEEQKYIVFVLITVGATRQL